MLQLQLTKKSSQGYTLIELMIVVAIIGIIARIAYPTYQQYIWQSHRAQAEATLMALANQMEQQYTQYGSYAGVAAPASSQYYSFQISPANPTNTYLLQAIPIIGAGQYNMDQCGTLGLDNLGNKSAAMNTGCW